MGKPHVLAIPYPAQGHVIPMMEIALCLANNGIKVTFVNTEFDHNRVMKALPQTGKLHELITLVSVSDGIESKQDRNDHGKQAEATMNFMPREFESLIKNLNETQSDEITCVLSDFYMSWALQVAENFSIKRAAFCPASAAMMATSIVAEKLVDDGIIDSNGTPMNNRPIKLSPSMPEMSPMHFAWTCLPDPTTRKIIFEAIIKNNESAKLAQQLICNSSHCLEPGALDFTPSCLPIGPLLSSSRHGKSSGYFWSEDSTCLSWLDQQPTNSVIYVAVGSFTVFDPFQFQELALGLELTNRPFLWVVREDITQEIDKTYPVGFKERIKKRGKIVDWAPQQLILSHPSVACFLSHCGWNSTIESISNGVPLLCWPYFADQFLNQSYIVDHWQVGLGLEKDETGIVRQEVIRHKVEQVVSTEGFMTRAVKLQAEIIAGVREGGCSQKNFDSFIDWIKEK